MQTSTLLDPAALLAATSSALTEFGSSVAAMPAHTYERKRINSKALMGGERELEIEHAGQLYRLRVTALGKLILTK